eukprot:1882122-Prymnesium_polylepis.1
MASRVRRRWSSPGCAPPRVPAAAAAAATNLAERGAEARGTRHAAHDTRPTPRTRRRTRAPTAVPVPFAHSAEFWNSALSDSGGLATSKVPNAGYYAPQVVKRCMDGRGAAGGALALVYTQLPFPYVHLLAVVRGRPAARPGPSRPRRCRQAPPARPVHAPPTWEASVAALARAAVRGRVRDCHRCARTRRVVRCLAARRRRMHRQRHLYRRALRFRGARRAP